MAALPHRKTVIASGLLCCALILVVLFTSPAAFRSPAAVVVISAIGAAAVLLQMRLRNDPQGPSAAGAEHAWHPVRAGGVVPGGFAPEAVAHCAQRRWDRWAASPSAAPSFSTPSASRRRSPNERPRGRTRSGKASRRAGRGRLGRIGQHRRPRLRIDGDLCDSFPRRTRSRAD